MSDKSTTSLDQGWFARCIEEYERAGSADFPLDWGSLRPCDDREGGAIFDAHYIHADLWAAKGVLWYLRRGVTHVDVGSRVDGLCTHLLAAGAPVAHVDVRAPAFSWPALCFHEDDARALAGHSDRSVSSLSCIHAAEHVGLGRYGDPIDPDGMTKTMASLARVLAPGGRLFFAVPIGRQRVVFNAHRVANPAWVLDVFTREGLTLEEFSAVDDAGKWCPGANPYDFADARYACGCFEFRRPS